MNTEISHSKQSSNGISFTALRVIQPFGEFYIAKLPAHLLLGFSGVDRLRIDVDSSVGTYSLLGSQRRADNTRMKEIADYAQSREAAFPNSIILAANYDFANGEVIDPNGINSTDRWIVEEVGSELFKITVPDLNKRIVAIVDGQHRLQAFKYLPANSQYLETELLCAIYFDLPNPYQAYIFATINFNQKKVDRSQAYELFGFDLESERASEWSPDKAAVFITRKLNTDRDSPFLDRIVIASQERIVPDRDSQRPWKVSTATVVDGILKLISSSPKKDRNHLYSIERGSPNRSQLPDDRSPLRSLYKDTNDLAVFTAIKNYFEAAREEYFESASADSFIFKTVGIQALFDVLVEILKRRFTEDRDISVTYFKKFLSMTDAQLFEEGGGLGEASGRGRTAIRNKIIQNATSLLESY
jgi:DNA phosphorothioation-associated DGQHR protein 1